MSAVEEQAPGGAGKSTHGLSVGDATRATLPQLGYADAVDAALTALRIMPDLIEAGVRREPGGGGRRELFLRLEWLPGHDDLVVPAAQASGLLVQWSHLAGWSAAAGGDVAVWPVDDLADPDVVAEAAMHAALCGLTCGCERAPGQDARWDRAVYLDIALVAYDERPDGVVV